MNGARRGERGVTSGVGKTEGVGGAGRTLPWQQTDWQKM